MEDLVERLRLHNDKRLYREADELMAEAADEIERLRQDERRINWMNEPNRNWTFWLGRSFSGGYTVRPVHHGDDLRAAIDSFYLPYEKK